jgi:hypothetical protein
MSDLATDDRATATVTTDAPVPIEPDPRPRYVTVLRTRAVGVYGRLSAGLRRVRGAPRRAATVPLALRSRSSWRLRELVARGRKVGALVVRFTLLAVVAVGAGVLAVTAGGVAARPVLADVLTSLSQDVDASVVTASVQGRSSAPETPELVAWVQSQTSLLPGDSRQIRVLVADGPGMRGSDSFTDDVQILTVELEVRQPPSARGTVSVTPSELTVDRAALARTRIDLELADGVACGADLGELRVRVRDVARDGAMVEVVAPLPPVDCREPPLRIG